MALSGSLYLSSSKAWEGRVHWSATQDISGNYSDVYVYAGMWKTDGYLTSSNSPTSGTITINGTSYDLIGYQQFKDEVCIFENTIRIYHDDDGSKSFSISLTCYGQPGTSLSGYTLSGSGSFDLDQIPRASSFAATDAAIGSVSTITIYRESKNINHRIKAVFGSVSGYVTNKGGFSSSADTITGTSVAFTIPTDFYQAIPNAKKGTCTLTLYALSGSEVIGDPVTTTIEITTVESRCNPTLTISLTHDNADTAELTGSNTAYIRGYSDAKCTVKATGRFGATISKIWTNGKYTDNKDGTYTVSPVNSETIIFYAKDSRGYTGQVSTNITLVPYVVLTNSASAGRPNPTDGSAFIQFQGQYFDDSFGAVRNTLSLKYKIEYPDGTLDPSWKTVTPTLSDDSYYAYISLSGFDYTKAYKVHTVVTDKLLNVEKTVILKQGIPVFDWGARDFQFHVPVDMDGNRIQGLGAPVEPNDALRLCDAPNPYPVGAIYISTVSTSPASLFGGSWEVINEKFLFAGSKSNYPYGSKGGSATHKLTVDEMPSHDHWGVLRPSWYQHEQTGQSSGSTDGSSSNQLYTDKAGGGKAHNNMPPYLSVYMWQRVS
jgi:hypothetical protein